MGEQETDESKFQNEWRFDPKLRKEFGNNFEAYVEFRKAEANGRARIIEGRTVNSRREG